MSLPARILVLGPSGAGKSTLARRIGASLGCPVVHLDSLYWTAGWVPSEPAMFRAKVAAAAVGDTWVMDGNYTSTLDLRLPRADTVVWLDLPRRVYFPRALWRSLRNYGQQRPDIGPGCPERFDPGFFRTWVWTYPSHSRARHAALMAGLPSGVRGITLGSTSTVRAFANGLPDTLASGFEVGHPLDASRGTLFGSRV